MVHAADTGHVFAVDLCSGTGRACLLYTSRIIAVLAVSISLLGIFLLLYEMYRVAKEYARSSQLDRENQLLAVESRCV